MLRNFELYRYGLRAPEGAAAGGAGAGGSPAGGGGGTPAGGGGTTGAGGAPSGGTPAGGGGAAPWYSSFNLDGDSTTYLASKNFDGLAPLVKSASMYETLARDRKAMVKPDPTKLLEWDGFTELGYDPDPAKYATKVPKPTMENGHVLNEEFWNGMLKAGHEAKVPPAQLQAVANWAVQWGNQLATANEAKLSGEIAAAEGALRKEWGNDYDTKRTVAKRAFQLLGIGAEDTRHLEVALGSPGLVKAFARLGELLGEEQLPGASGGSVGFGRSPSTITAELKKWETDNVSVIKDRRDPRYEDVMARRQKLIDELERAGRGRT